MPSRLFLFCRPLLAFSAILVAMSLGGSIRGQDELPGNTQDEMEKEMMKKKPLLDKLLAGTTPFDANNKDHLEALDIGARYDTYRYTWVSVKVDEVYTDFEKHVLSIKNTNKTPQQPEVASAYSKAVAARAREVINLRRKPNNLARLNAARVLAKLADLKQGDLADALLEVFTQELARDADPKASQRNDGVVYYSLRGLRELLSLPPPAPDKPIVSVESDKKIAEALVAFIAKAPAFTKDTPIEEKNGYRALRREAVHALAYTRPPDQPNKGVTLLRIMARDGFTPAPHIDEAVEAAIGVARLRNEIDGKDFQSEYAAFQLAQFVEYFTKYYVKNRDTAPGAEKRPYRVYASRLLEALEAMQAETKSDYVKRAIDECRKVLTFVEKGELVKTADLSDWLTNNPPPKDGLFQGVADSTAKPANRDMKDDK